VEGSPDFAHFSALFPVAALPAVVVVDPKAVGPAR